MLYERETAGDGGANPLDDANCESVSGFVSASEVVGNVKMFPLIPYDDSDKLDVSEAHSCFSLTKLTRTEWGRIDLRCRKLVGS
jgi:hypothetical protein